MGWHLTWQDPVAIALGVLCLAFTWWLRRRVPASTGCAACPSKEAHGHGRDAKPEPQGAAAPTMAIPLSSTRLGRRR